MLGCGLVAAAAPAPLVAVSGNLTRGCVERFDPAADYFPDKTIVEDAVTFGVEYRRSYKIVRLTDAQSGGQPEQYVLVQCGTPAPPLTGALAGAQLVTVPVASLFASSSTHLPLLSDLGRLDVLTGVASVDFITDADIRARIKAGRITEFAKVGLAIDVERVVAARPSLLMGGDSLNATLGVIRNAGVPVVANREWLEPTALGRAECLKYMAVFLNEERRAQMLHDAMKARYHALRARAVARPDAARPLVMTGRSTRGQFTVSGGRSYVAALIHDAGGRYAWAANTAVGIVSVDLEAQVRQAAQADIWINGGGWTSLTAMVEDEPRYREFASYRRGQVWTFERRQTPSGANDYWSRSVTRPDLVLADLIKIFHPNLMRDHAFEWYMPVPPVPAR